MEKVKEEEFIRVCRLAKLVERKAKIPTFITFDQKEGLALTGGKIISFLISGMEKEYDRPVGNKDLIAVIGAFEKEPSNQPVKEINKEERIINKEDVGVLPQHPLIGMMPVSLTKELIQKWALLPVAERLIMLQNTDPSQIEERKGRAGQKYKYVSISYMIKAANMAFGFAWSVKVISWIETTTEIICHLELIVDMGNKTITKAAIGQKDITFKSGTKEPLCKGDDYKACEADGIKKALSLFGIAQDVYSGEV